MCLIGFMVLLAAAVIIATAYMFWKDKKYYKRIPKFLFRKNMIFSIYFFAFTCGVGISFGTFSQTIIFGKLQYHLSIILIILGLAISIASAVIYYNKHMEEAK